MSDAARVIDAPPLPATGPHAHGWALRGALRGQNGWGETTELERKRCWHAGAWHMPATSGGRALALQRMRSAGGAGDVCCSMTRRTHRPVHETVFAWALMPSPRGKCSGGVIDQLCAKRLREQPLRTPRGGTACGKQG